MDKAELLRAASAARENSYAPYSRFAVGAALLTTNGKIFAGCNVENISLGLTVCAERSCVAQAISAGQQNFTAILLFADTMEPIVPCGACRQFLAEFAPDLIILSKGKGDKIAEYRLSDLLPRPKQGILDHG